MDYSDLHQLILDFMNRESEQCVHDLTVEINSIILDNKIKKFQRIAKNNGRRINVKKANNQEVIMYIKKDEDALQLEWYTLPSFDGIIFILVGVAFGIVCGYLEVAYF